MTEENTYALPDLGFEYSDLEPEYSAELIELHYDKHHRSYVDGANDALVALDEARADRKFDHIAGLEAELAFQVSGHVLHCIFWGNIKPGSGDRPDDTLALDVSKHFGDTDSLREQFLAAGTSIHGSGWAALSWEPRGQRLLVEQIHDHHGNSISGSVPILVMDMWEHAFYLQFKNEKKRWAKTFWSLVNWSDVSTRYLRARSSVTAG